MTRDETKIILMTLSEAYRGRFSDVNSKTVDLWHKMLEDMNYKEIEVYVVDWIAREKWPPTIADIRSSRAENIITAINGRDASEAWEELQNSIRRYGYYKRDEGIAALSPDTREIVRRLGGYTQFCLSEEDDTRTLYAQFRDAYNGLISTRKRRLQTPKQVITALQDIANKYLENGSPLLLEDTRKKETKTHSDDGMKSLYSVLLHTENTADKTSEAR